MTYRASGARVAGVGFAAIRDAAAAFRYRTDLPIRGTRAYVIGISQSGRFLRQFLYEGFNADERDRRAFDACGPTSPAQRSSFNEPFAMPRHLAPFAATRPPFTLQPADGRKDSLLSAYKDERRPKILLTNSPVEYWGNGRAAALTSVGRWPPRPADSRERPHLLLRRHAARRSGAVAAAPCQRSAAGQPDAAARG